MVQDLRIAEAVDKALLIENQHYTLPAGETTQAQEETQPATIPADGNPDDVTCKGTYTGTDADVLAAAKTVVAKAGELDFITGDLGAMLGLAYQDYFGDLSEVLSREQYEAYAPFFLYIDRAVLEQMNGATGESGEAPPEIPDCRKPETMERPVPVLIDMSGSGALRGVYGDYAETLAFGLVVNAPHPENTLKYIDYLMR